MTLSEFKAWFEGFAEGIDKAPTEKQFAKIKAKVALIDGTITTYPVFIDRYPVLRTWPYYWSGDQIIGVGYSSGATAGHSVGNDAIAGSYSYIDPASKGDNQTIEWDSHAAMRDLGRAEAMN